VIHVYAIVRELQSLPSIRGLSDSALERMRIEGFDVVASRPGSEAEPSDEAVVRHAQIVEALQPRSHAVLPARFGDRFPDENQLIAAVRSKRAELDQALTRVGGRVEFGLRVLLPESELDEQTPVGSGREYMGRRLAETRRQRLIADEIHTPLARLAEASTRQEHSTFGLLLTAAYLVPEESAEMFRVEVQRLQSLHPDWSIACSGPWPPYSFAADFEAD
jgi:hypothetical protein